MKKKCKCSVKKWKNGRHFSRHASRLCPKSRATVEIQTLQGGEERGGSHASQLNGCCSVPAMWEQCFACGATQTEHFTQAMQREFHRRFKAPDALEHRATGDRSLMHVVARKEVSTCMSRGPKGEWIERTYDYVVACNSLTGQFSRLTPNSGPK